MKYSGLLLLFLIIAGCSSQEQAETTTNETEQQKMLTDKYISVPLKADLQHLSDNQKEMVRIMIRISKIMDDLFWYESFGDKESLLTKYAEGDTNAFLHINYGPWDRLDNNSSFISEFGPKPDGANFYPADMTKEEFESVELEGKQGLYTFIRRDQEGSLVAVPYHVELEAKVKEASDLLKEAAELAEDEGLKKYLNLRAEALLSDEYQESDMAWMDMKSNMIDFVVGPIENYEDKLFNYKTAHEAYVLIKDMSWSERLSKYVDFLPELQQGLPVDETYKQDEIGTNADLNAYDVVYYAGDCNAGSKTIAINLPNDEVVQQQKGSRRLQLKNAMEAKFNQILLPIADVLIEEEQRSHISFDAFFANTMFHEVAHGLGIKNTINGNGTVRKALKEHASAIEEGKADILGLYMITQLHEKGELDADLQEFYVTFLAGIFRSVRFGAASAHGRANMIRFNFFQELGAFERNEETGLYKVNFEKMQEAMNELSSVLLTLQGDGNYEGVTKLINEKGIIGNQLQADLDRLEEAMIPVDIVFEQGVEVLGL